MFVLLSGLIILFMLAIFLSKGDYLRPSIIVSGVMFGGAVCATYLSFVWGFQLYWLTVVLFLMAVTEVVLIDALVVRSHKNRHIIINLSKISVNKFVTLVIIIFGIIVFYLHYKYLIRAVGSLGSLGAMATSYRKRIVWETLDVYMPGYLTRSIRLMSNFAYIYIYIFINNCILEKKLTRNIYYLFPVVLYVGDSFLMGARGYFLYIIFGGIVYTYILLQRKNGWSKSKGYTYLKRIFVILVIIALVFIVLGGVVGRQTSGTVFYRLSTYFGGGIPLFNDYLIHGRNISPGFGASTFTTFYSFMSRRFGWDSFSEFTQMEFRYHNGVSWGNVYTALRRYYQDFGTAGVIILVGIFSVFYSRLYVYIRNKSRLAKIDFALLYYGILCRGLFLFFFDDELFNDFFSPSIVMNIIEMLICIWIVGLFNGEKKKLNLFQKKYCFDQTSTSIKT